MGAGHARIAFVGLRAGAGSLAGSRWMGLWLALLHVTIAFLEYCRGLDFTSDAGRCQWDWFWQAIPLVDLRQHPWESFWRLHAQPPGFSLWGGFWYWLGGPQAFPADIQVGYVLLGAAVVAMTWHLARVLLRSRRWALAAGLGMALNPALFYFEAYLLYELLVIFLVVASAWCLWGALVDRRWRWLVGFIMLLNALVLTRSLYHLAFLAGALAFAGPLWRQLRPGRRWALLLLAIVMPTAWYAKNAAQYGFFGASSWYGIGLFKCIEKGFSYQELLDLRRRGVIPEYVEQLSSFSHAPNDFRRYGFNQISSVALLSRNDFHSIIIPPVSAGFAASAKCLILSHPARFVRAVHNSYTRFCRPPSRFAYLEAQRGHIAWEPLISQILYGQAVTDAVELLTRFQCGSLFYFYFPLLMFGGTLWGVRQWRDTPATVESRARALLMAYFLYVCLYVAVIGCLLENGENERFRFATEPLTLIIALTLLRAWWWRWGRRVAVWLRPELRFSRKSPAR